jgi:hypothetical protein
MIPLAGLHLLSLNQDRQEPGSRLMNEQLRADRLHFRAFLSDRSV